MKVPQLKTRQQVGNVFLGQPRATSADFGGAAIEALKPGLQAASEFAMHEYQAANIASVQDAESSLYEWENNSLYGDGGLYSKKGKAAMGASDELIASFDTYSAEVMGTLTNDVQKAAFKQSLESRRKDLMKSSSRHQFNEIQNYKVAQSAAYVANSQLAAADNYSDPARVDQEVKRQTDSIRATSTANGISPEETKIQIEVAASKTYTSVTKRMLDNKEYDSASAYFEQVKDRILPDQQDALKKQIDIGNVRAESQRSTDEIVSQNLTEAQALAKARAIKDPEVRDQTVTRVKTRYAEIEGLKAEAKTQAYQQAANIVEEAGSVDEVPPAIWATMTAAQRSSLETRSRQVSSGVEPVTDWIIWTRLNEMSPEELSKVDMWEYRPSLSNSHYQQFSSEQQSILQKEETGQSKPELSSTLTFKDRSKKTAVDAGIIPAGKTPTKWSDDESVRYGNFQTEAAARIEAFELETGKKATGTEQQQILDQMVIEKVSIKEWGRDPEFFTYEVTQDMKGDSYVPYSEIPEDEVNSAKNLIKSRGIPATKSRIERLFAAMLLGDRSLAEQILGGN